MKHVQTWEVQTRSQVKFNKNTAPYFVSHLDSMSSNKLTSHCISSSQFHWTWAYARLQPSSYMNLATSCNLVHVLTSYNPFVTYLWNLCSASAIQLLNLGNSFAIQFILICCMSKLSQQNTSLWFHAFRFRLAQPVTCSKILKSISLRAMTIRANFPNDFVRHAQVQLNCKSQIPDSLFCFSLWATRQRKATLPFYSSLRILCKVW